MEVLTSCNNPKVKAYSALKDKKYREKTGLYLVEGIRFITEYIEAGVELEAVLFDSFGTHPDQILAIVDACSEKGIHTYELTGQVLAHVVDTEHSQGIVAAVRKKEFVAQTVLQIQQDVHLNSSCQDVVVIADGIRDPGNLGTMIRSIDAVGSRALIITPGTTDPYQPKVVRAAAGSLARVPVLTMDHESILNELHSFGYRVMSMEAHHGASVFETDLRGPLAIVIGGEAAGISLVLQQSSDMAVSLPMPGSSESLNAGVASAVIMYEALRQRLAK